MLIIISLENRKTFSPPLPLPSPSPLPPSPHLWEHELYFILLWKKKKHERGSGRWMDIEIEANIAKS